MITLLYLPQHPLRPSLLRLDLILVDPGVDVIANAQAFGEMDYVLDVLDRFIV
jgi:hypothetical protein